MTEEEMRAFEQRAPTTLPQERPSHRSWDEELFYAAGLGDIPRMARALDHGARPKALDQYKRTVASHYAFGTDTNDMRCHFASSGIDQHQAWAWLKARGVPTTEAWNFLYGSLASHADPLESKCAEVNLWALWKSLSQQERWDTLTQIDKLFSQEDPSPSSEGVTALKGIPAFTSPLMKEAIALRDITCSPCGNVLPTDRLQDRLLALSSLMRGRQVQDLESEQHMLLGLWAYAPPPLLHDMTALPSYRPLLTECLTSLIDTFHKNARYPDGSMKRVGTICARRLARGTRTLLQNGFEFSPEDIALLLTVDDVRPLLEHSLFKETLSQQETLIRSTSNARSRARL